MGINNRDPITQLCQMETCGKSGKSGAYDTDVGTVIAGKRWEFGKIICTCGIPGRGVFPGIVIGMKQRFCHVDYTFSKRCSRSQGLMTRMNSSCSSRLMPT